LSDKDFFKHEGGRYCASCIDRVSVSSHNSGHNTSSNYGGGSSSNYGGGSSSNYGGGGSSSNYGGSSHSNYGGGSSNDYDDNDHHAGSHSHASKSYDDAHKDSSIKKPTVPDDDFNDDDDAPVIEHQATIIEPEDIVVDGFDFEIKNDDDDDDFDLNKMINEVDALGTEISEGKNPMIAAVILTI